MIHIILEIPGKEQIVAVESCPCIGDEVRFEGIAYNVLNVIHTISHFKQAPCTSVIRVSLIPKR